MLWHKTVGEGQDLVFYMVGLLIVTSFKVWLIFTLHTIV